MVQRGDNVKDIQFSALPEGLITKPTLVWKLATEKPGEQLVEVAYQTAGINWQSDYNAVLNAKDTALDLGGWVTINNQSGATYKDAKLKLIAGDVRRVAAAGVPRLRECDGSAMGCRRAGLRGESVFRVSPLHVGPAHDRGRQPDQADRIAQDRRRSREEGLPLRRRAAISAGTADLITDAGYGSEEGNKKVNVIIEVKNSQDNHMGMPLPKGKVRLYKRDPADASLEFIGEDQIDHTPKDETVSCTSATRSTSSANANAPISTWTPPATS